MKIKELIEQLKEYNNLDDEVIFYHLENSVLTECQVENILNVDDRCEITIEELWGEE